MRAIYPGICPLCDGSIRPNDLIVRRREQYVHAACAGGGDE